VRIISRYVLREHLGPLAFAMSALTSLLLLNYVAKQLPQLVGKGLPWEVIAEFILLSLPFTIAMTLPMAVLVATLHAFSRLAADSEITAFKASGLALPRLMAPVIVAGLVLSLVMVWFNDQMMPAANYKLQTLMNDIARKKPTFALRPQVINEVVPMKLFLKAGRLESGSADMRDVTIFDFSDGSRRRTIVADTGQVALSPDGRDLILSLQHGSMTEVSRTEPNRLQRVFFTRNYVRVRNIGNELERNNDGGVKSDRERTVCELQAQLRVAVARRDTVVTRLRKLDSATVRAAGEVAPPVIGPFGDPRSTGDLYCRFVRMFRTAEAHAAEPGIVLAQSGQSPPPAQAPVQAPVAQKPDSQLKASPGMDSAAKKPAYAPSVGMRMPAGFVEDTTQPNVVQIEGLKSQLQLEQQVIRGNHVEIEKKFAIAIACVIFALLGAPIAFRFPRSGVGMTIGVSLAVFGIYYVGLVLGESLARKGYVPAWIAMWATNLVLLLIGIVLTARLGTEGTTTRGSDMSDAWARFMERFRRRPPGPSTA
jgi:lipopolysaccharide export system permease protein